jgi:hypothetical protein
MLRQWPHLLAQASIGEHVRMAAHDLLLRVSRDGAEVGPAALLQHQSAREQNEEHVAELFGAGVCGPSRAAS